MTSCIGKTHSQAQNEISDAKFHMLFVAYVLSEEVKALYMAKTASK